MILIKIGQTARDETDVGGKKNQRLADRAAVIFQIFEFL